MADFLLRFSKVDNEIINFFIKNYSKIIPFIGKYVVGSSIPYEYLIKGIDKFYNKKGSKFDEKPVFLKLNTEIFPAVYTIPLDGKFKCLIELLD